MHKIEMLTVHWTMRWNAEFLFKKAATVFKRKWTQRGSVC